MPISYVKKIKKKSSPSIKNPKKNINITGKKFKVLQTRDFDGLNKDTLEIIHIITMNEYTHPVGSFKYRAHRFPGDIDIMERVKGCCNVKEASMKFAKKLKNIAQHVINNKGMYWADAKVGIDIRFNIDIGEFSTKRGHAEILNYHSDKIRTKLSLVHKLLPNSEYVALVKLVKNKPTVTEWEELKDKLREHYIVRWTANEIISGWKFLRGKHKITLVEALTHNSIVKVDLWAKVQGRYNETTNFFLVIAVDKNGKETVINQSMGDRLEGLDSDIQKYKNSKAHYNSLKMAKRIWNKAIFKQDNRMLEKLYPLFGSDVAHLNQIVGESEVIRNMITKLKFPPYKDLMEQIDGFKRRINDASFLPNFNTKDLYNLINEIIDKYIRDKGHHVDHSFITRKLEKLEETLKKIIEAYSFQYLKSVGIDMREYENRESGGIHIEKSSNRRRNSKRSSPKHENRHRNSKRSSPKRSHNSKTKRPVNNNILAFKNFNLGIDLI